jgi:shikimate dehydrogenase
MPHKQAVLPLLDAIDPEAARIGAINTVVRDPDGRLTGFNTDAPGFLEPVLPLLGDHAFYFAYLIGTGGAARAIIDALFHHEFLIWSISRNPDKAKAEFFDYLGRDEDFLLDLADLAAGPVRPADPEVFSLVINATPLGMTGHAPLELPWAGFLGNAVAYDIVTAPADTLFLQQARAQGLKTIDGLAMLIGQAAVAFEKFFGQPAPREHDAELRALLTR